MKTLKVQAPTRINITIWSLKHFLEVHQIMCPGSRYNSETQFMVNVTIKRQNDCF